MSQHTSMQVAATLTGSLSLCASLGILLLPLVATGPAESFQYALVAVLSFFNAFESLCYVIGPALTVGIDHPHNTTAPCVAQGVVMQFSSMAAFCWILFFCVTLFQTTRSGGGADLLARRATAKNVAPKLGAVVAAATITCLGLTGTYGDAVLWCWVHNPTLGLLWYYLPLCVIWLLAIASVGYSCYMVGERAKVVRREIDQRHQSVAATTAGQRMRSIHSFAPDVSTTTTRSNSATPLRQSVSELQKRATRQLSAYLVVFIFFSTFGLANRLASAIRNQPSPFWLVMLQAMTMPLQGFANGVVFAAWVRDNWKLRLGVSPMREEVVLAEVCLDPMSPERAPADLLHEQPMAAVKHVASIFAARFTSGAA